MSINKLDIAWLAGLLEGEGCFLDQRSPGIKVGMTDKDIVDKIATLLGSGKPYKYEYGVHKKPVYFTQIWGKRAICWMMTLYTFMGERRKQKIRELITRWIKAPTKINKCRVKLIPKCHPEKRHYAHGFCSSCYVKDRRKKDKKIICEKDETVLKNDY